MLPPTPRAFHSYAGAGLMIVSSPALPTPLLIRADCGQVAVPPAFKTLGQPAPPIIYLASIPDRSDTDSVPDQSVCLVGPLDFND